VSRSAFPVCVSTYTVTVDISLSTRLMRMHVLLTQKRILLFVLYEILQLKLKIHY
jgi:hypothetical protein